MRVQHRTGVGVVIVYCRDASKQRHTAPSFVKATTRYAGRLSSDAAAMCKVSCLGDVNLAAHLPLGSNSVSISSDQYSGKNVRMAMTVLAG